MKLDKRQKDIVLLLTRDAIVAFLITYLILRVFFNVVIVTGTSMQPTLQNGELIITQCTFYSLKRGDIVTFKLNGTNQIAIKRIIGMPGDVLDISRETGEVKVNGNTLHEPYIADVIRRDFGDKMPVQVKDGYLYLLGDNRNNSIDSRDPIIGQVKETDVKGKYIFSLSFHL